MPDIVVIAAAIAALLLIRMYAARQIAGRRRGWWIWAYAFPRILGPVVLAWAGVRLMSMGEVFGAVLLGVAIALAALDVWFFRRTSRAVSEASPDEDLGGVLIEPLADYTLILMVGGMLFAIVIGIGFVVWAVLT